MKWMEIISSVLCNISSNPNYFLEPSTVVYRVTCTTGPDSVHLIVFIAHFYRMLILSIIFVHYLLVNIYS
jgi:hypothetical protein